MSGTLIAALVVAGWVELGTGLPSDQEITTVSFGDGPDELFVGTTHGELWQSEDGGETFLRLFRPTDVEPVVDLGLRNVRAASVGDLGRGVDGDVPVRDRAGQARRQADLAGTVRDRPREQTSPLLASVVRDEARELVAVTVAVRCDAYLFVATQAGLWRGEPRGTYFERLHVGDARDDAVLYVSCDESAPSHLLASTESGVFESFDSGESFARFADSLSRELDFAFFSGDTAYAQVGASVLRWDRGAGTWRGVCLFVTDGVAGGPLYLNDDSAGGVYFATSDGLARCKDGVNTRIGDGYLQGSTVRALDVRDGGRRLLATTNDMVLESSDSGASFSVAFRRPTSRSLMRTLVHPDRPAALIVYSGGQIFRREDQQAETVPAAAAALLERVPLTEVLRATMDLAQLDPGTIAARRSDVRLRRLMPEVVVRFAHLDRGESLAQADRVRLLGPAPVVTSSLDRSVTAWSAFLVFDLAGLVFDAVQTDTIWADMERLRRELTFRVEDAYVAWARSRMAVERSDLTPVQRAYHRVRVRENAAYLGHMTGGAIAQFIEDARR